MREFKLGDKIVIGKNSIDVTPGTSFIVVEKLKVPGVWIDCNAKEVDVKYVGKGYVNSYADFKLDEEKRGENRFAVGDHVISIKNTPEVPEGFIGHITSTDSDAWSYTVDDGKGKSECFNEDELELLSAAKQELNDIKVPHDSIGLSFDDPKMKLTPADFVGIARPVLEERKIGKIKMELFDEGFPNAIMEIARVMTWAAEHKGYKPHDWKNLPNADTEFSAAASRHKIKSFIQKVEGVEPLQRTDEESKITHLAHQAFNVLAELELVLTGVIK